MTGQTISSHYVGRSGADYFAYQRRIGELGATLNLFKFEQHLSSSMRVADFGCGNGALLANLPACERWGVEVNAAAAEVARDNGLTIVSTAADLPAEYFDAIISNHALEHCLYPFDELRELRRALRRGGQLILCLPFDDWRRHRRYDPRDLNHHLYTWTPLAIGHLVTEAGFRVESVDMLAYQWGPKLHKFVGRWPRLFQMACRLNALRVRMRQVLVRATAEP